MSLALFMDVHVPRAVSVGLRHRQVDCLMAQEDGSQELEDPDLLDRATSLGRVLVTHDEDFLREAARRQQAGISFAGVIYASQQQVSIGQLVTDLELLAKVYDPPDMENRVEYLPL